MTSWSSTIKIHGRRHFTGNNSVAMPEIYLLSASFSITKATLTSLCISWHMNTVLIMFSFYATRELPTPVNNEYTIRELWRFALFGGLVVSMLASGTQDRGFDPGRSRRIFRAKKSTACLPWGGSKAVSHVADLRGMSKNPGFTWKSESQAKLTGHFSPMIPSFADRGLSCRLHVEAPRGESGNV